MDPDNQHALLCHAGLLMCAPQKGEPIYVQSDGSMGRAVHGADVVSLGPPPLPHTPLILQVSRWDALKDPMGVMRGFARLVDMKRDRGAHLMLAGPNVHAVADDPDGTTVYDQTLCAWRSLPHDTRRRVHLAMLPSHDIEENAALVNALQRQATVVVQKSLQEGFGLTVTEAMWKSKPVVASRVGGLQDQISHEVTGLLLDDPTDTASFADALARLLQDPSAAERMGKAAHAFVQRHFLALRSLQKYGDLIERLDAAATD